LADPTTRALVIDPRGADAEFVRRALRPEFGICLAGDYESVDRALHAQDFAVALVVADHDAVAARRVIAEVARRAPSASRVAIAAPSDPDVFGLEAAGAEHVVLRPVLEAALRLAVRSARRAFDLRRAVDALRPDMGALASDLARGATGRLGLGE
jgi:hypothetical protein